MAVLSTQQRKNLGKASFAIPEKAPGPGSYPIPDENHARDALSRASGKPEESRVRAAVKRKYPNIGKDEEAGESKAQQKAEGPKGEAAEKAANGRMNDYMRRRAGVRAS